ncbi:MAG: hypothetical protein FWG62_04370 [Proteobacteria bacterium]|nr:hypothetical protein [Pseudomonadota bacterium]
MAQKKQAQRSKTVPSPETGEQAMIAAILEGSPEAVGVAVLRLDCGCRKMAAVNQNGDPASKIIMYRDNAQSVCDQCKDDQGNVQRVIKQFISWKKPEPDHATMMMISTKVLGN